MSVDELTDDDSGWPDYSRYLSRLQAVADDTVDIPEGNKGAGMFATAMVIQAKEMTFVEIAEWLRHQAAGFDSASRNLVLPQADSREN